MCEPKKILIFKTIFCLTLYPVLAHLFSHYVPLTLPILDPSGKVLNLRADQIGSDIKLSWEEMQEEDKRGVILGYIVSYKLSVGDLPTGKANLSSTSISLKLIFPLRLTVHTFSCEIYNECVHFLSSVRAND